MSICPCNCKYHRSIDIRTPRMVPLSAFYKRSFAFLSIRERYPVVIKKLMEDLMKRRDEFAKDYGECVREELKKAVDELAALKYELQSNRELTPIISDDPDAQIFNYYLQRRRVEDGHTAPYNTNILYAEAYMYRRLREVFEKKKLLKDYDHFKKIKQDAFEDAVPVMRELAIHMEEGCECISDKDAIFDLMKISLWANKYDLSINKGVEHGTHLNMARKMEPNVVCDHSEAIWEAYRSNKDNDTISYVPDNAGYELFCDLCLSDMLFTKGLTSHITFHTKTIPAYVSDVTKEDILWMIQTLKQHIDPHLRCLGQRWDDYIATKSWEIEADPFWHYPLDYTYMQQYAPELHDKLATANLIIFKGDLQYRKLFGDINWDPDIPVDQGLRGFLPAKLCIMRTIKYGVICGISSEVAEKCTKADFNWKESGNYGVIQYCDTIYVEPPQEELIFPPDPGAEGTEGEEAPKEAGDLEEEPPAEGAGDLGQVDETGGEAGGTAGGGTSGASGGAGASRGTGADGGLTRSGDDVAKVVANIVGHTSQVVDREWGENRIQESEREQLQRITEAEKTGGDTVTGSVADKSSILESGSIAAAQTDGVGGTGASHQTAGTSQETGATNNTYKYGGAISSGVYKGGAAAEIGSTFQYGVVTASGATAETGSTRDGHGATDSIISDKDWDKKPVEEVASVTTKSVQYTGVSNILNKDDEAKDQQKGLKENASGSYKKPNMPEVEVETEKKKDKKKTPVEISVKQIDVQQNANKKADPSEEPHSPSEVSIEHSPGVDGEEAPE